MSKFLNWGWLFSGLAILHHFIALPGLWYGWSNILLTLLLIALIWIMRYLAVRFSSARKLIYNFIFPMVLGLSTLILGTFAFHATEIAEYKKPGDSFFGAANLITLNSSTLKDIAGRQPILIVARTLGGLTAVYAFILAFSLAAGREGMDRFKFWMFRLFKSAGKGFIVIIGEGSKTLHLALNTEKDIQAGKEKRKVVVMTNEAVELFKNKSVWLINGNLSDKKDMDKTYFWEAEEVHVLSDDDEENFRITQELNCIIEEPKKGKNGNWYIHQNDLRQRELLCKLDLKYDSAYGINENIVRKLFREHPIDRFKEQGEYVEEGSVTMVILGFNDMACDLVIQALRLGHFEDGKNLKILVYHNAEASTIDKFKNRYPVLSSKYFEGEDGKKNSRKKEAQEYAFPIARHGEIIEFKKLPESEAALCNVDWDFYKQIAKNRITNIYVCLESGLKSTALLTSILPRIQYLLKGTEPKDCPTQIFCQYPLSETTEVTAIEKKMNEKFAGIPIYYFGNILQECNVATIRNDEQDVIAKNIALLYHILYADKDINLVFSEEEPSNRANQQKDSIVFPYVENEDEVARMIRFKSLNIESKVTDAYAEKIWNKMSENHRASNRDAADHAHVKNRMRTASKDKALEKFKTLVDEVWAMKNANSIEKYQVLFDRIKKDKIPHLAEIEHRRWVAANLLDGFSPLANTSANKDLWAADKNALKSQKIHADLVPFEKLGWELIDDQDGWVSKSKDISAVYGISFKSK